MAQLGRAQPFQPKFRHGYGMPALYIFFNVLTLGGQVTLSAVGVSDAIVRLIQQSTDLEVAKTITDGSGNYNFLGYVVEGEAYHVTVEYTNGGTKYNAKSLWDVNPIRI